jgi:hypothetical protein
VPGKSLYTSHADLIFSGEYAKCASTASLQSDIASLHIIAHIHDAGEWGGGQTADEGSTTQICKIDYQK